ISLPRACKEMFEKQANKKTLLSEAIVEVFGQGAYARLETAGPKGAKPAPAKVAAPKPATPPAPAPMPAAPVRLEPPSDDPPPPEPPDWLDEVDSAAPEAAPMPGAVESDEAVKLATDLFNGRVVPGARLP
ncbi:MAG TPA: hypothetical protein V6D47_20445, partial [Oscillatoriaceae cyanobacterium]